MARTSTPDRPLDDELAQARATRWWVRGRRVGSVERAGKFIDDVGFALLFPAPKPIGPSLWEAVAGEDAEPFADGMGEAEQKVWSWKDELPRRGLAWYGAFVGGRGTFLSPTLLAALYPGEGELDDHERLELSPVAHELAAALAMEPLSSASLRTLVGDKNSYQRGIGELQKNLLVTTAGIEEQSNGWPATLLTLTCEQFEVGGRPNHSEAARQYLDTMLDTSAAELARAFRWPTAEARELLDEVAGTADGRRYQPL
ncbi:AlkZ-related protein [Kribbella sp. CA-294648]|uniref:AlkZ-related protein n=1 Tax=Kribbella sp. CA-294648 TaxID=3239948 RepID=UPI003D8BF2B9